MQNKTPGLLYLFLFVLSGCATYQQAGIEIASKGEYCDPRNESEYDSTFIPIRNIDSVLNGSLGKKYPKHLLLIANASGVLHFFRELQVIEKLSQTTDSEQIRNRIAQKKEQINARLTLVATEIASLETELSCERDRCQQVINYLSEKENQKIRRATSASIVTGALTTIGLAFVSGEEQIKEFAIVGGALTAVLGLRTLFVHKEIEFIHPRNLLSDIWFKSATTKTYPASIWYVLTEKSFTDQQQFSISYYIQQRWQSQIESYKISKQKNVEGLFFGKGGSYGIQELRIRENMLSLIQVGVSLTNHELKLLMLEMAK